MSRNTIVVLSIALGLFKLHDVSEAGCASVVRRKRGEDCTQPGLLDGLALSDGRKIYGREEDKKKQ
jgi:hypothetical protein